MACAAAGSLPALGLQWLQDPAAALALLTTGMLVNLWMAAMAPGQDLASLHVAVNLVPLLVVDQGAASLTIAAAVALAGTLMRPHRPWPRHRLVVGGSFQVFEMVWVLRMDSALDGTAGSGPGLRMLAITVAMVVFGTGLLLLLFGFDRYLFQNETGWHASPPKVRIMATSLYIRTEVTYITVLSIVLNPTVT